MLQYKNQFIDIVIDSNLIDVALGGVMSSVCCPGSTLSSTSTLMYLGCTAIWKYILEEYWVAINDLLSIMQLLVTCSMHYP